MEGRAKVHIEELHIGRLERGDCFGEMSLFDAKPRCASVTTLEECRCLVLTQAQVFEAIYENPAIALNIIRLLSGQIHKLNLCQHLRKFHQPPFNRQALAKLI